MHNPKESLFLGVDVGTSSARAAVVDGEGRIKAIASHPLEINHPLTDYYEQSSDNIWEACCMAVQQAVDVSGVDARSIKGIGFDATCSLVALDDQYGPVSVSPSGNPKWNVIMWMDHRAQEEADEMSATGHSVLKRTGGKISPEMSAAKILWLYRKLPEAYQSAQLLLELPDFLTLKATSYSTRGLNSLSCKWTYESGKGWSTDFWTALGMRDVVQDGFKRFGGQQVVKAGEPIGRGLTEQAAKELGLGGAEGAKVGGAVIDAYAGALGTIGAESSPGTGLSLEHVQNRMAVICGTSSCHIALSPHQAFVSGVWGPYADILLPDFHIAEGGQSITGALLHHLITTHPAYTTAQKAAQAGSLSIYSYLNALIARESERLRLPFWALLTQNIHITPDFHGNRSPLADPHIKGAMLGCDLDTSETNLIKCYYAGVLSLCYGTRMIIDALKKGGYNLNTLFLSGGLTQNELFVQSLADCCGCRTIIPEERDAVLVGAAVIGATASEWGKHNEREVLWKWMKKMGRVGKVVEPCVGEERIFHDKKYNVFVRLYQVQREVRDVMSEFIQ
ncbi:FGGY-family pentulose kinase [Spizellomyces punctatus DAOM BR117]|uniref:FGGY-family pentulose kinase n=1 Tax=Spizellomyces punctatus (strain DAOM BR117) TaxID=645134 RepID=A0A0L0H4J7_SPIPD|nr:FGGY-family pentulose kinase [Spizellomyces punctatus DAOM BR117]KNC96440.1 FGGY-family pentulose kinase [Spizellomyces punctatus DAOM BR117]|eukprot:XP_016604480.1 FGGY-family pentulose kinase [Spizellomyces punctatus DAOM BR117]